MPPAALDDVLVFAEWAGVSLFPWQREAFGAACRREGGHFAHRLGGISVPRGVGKSLGGAVVGVWRLVCTPAPADLISAALDRDGARVVLRHAKQIVRACPALSRAIEIRADELVVHSTGSRWRIVSREHESSRGIHGSTIIMDEQGWAKDDELFASLLSGQASEPDPFMLIISTVGRRQLGPLWTVKTLAEGGDPGTFWYWSGDSTLSPRVTQAFLDRQRAILPAPQFAREHGNQWLGDQADAFCTAEQVDRAMGHGWVEQPSGASGVDYVAFVDLGVIHDPSVVVVAHAEDSRVFVDRILEFKGSHQEPVRLASVMRALLALANQFHLTRVQIESWQGMGIAQELQQCLPCEVFTPSQKTNMDQWPLLAQRLANGTILLPPHARLRAELLNLTVDLGPTGAKVSDKGKVHQDIAVCVRGVVAMLGQVAGQGYVVGANLAQHAVRAGIGGEADEARAYAREQLQAEREALRRELRGDMGGPLFDGYGSRSRRWQDGF